VPREIVPNKGGRGIEGLRLSVLAAARFQGTSCYINLSPSARHYRATPARPATILFIKTVIIHAVLKCWQQMALRSKTAPTESAILARSRQPGHVLAYLFRIRHALVRCLRPPDCHASCRPCNCPPNTADEAAFLPRLTSKMHHGWRHRVTCALAVIRRGGLASVVVRAASIGMRHGSHLHRVTEPDLFWSSPAHGSPASRPLWNHPPSREHACAWTSLTDDGNSECSK